MQKIFAIFDGTTDDQTEKFVDSARQDTIGNDGVDLNTEEGKQKYKKYVGKLNGEGANGTLESAVKKDERCKFTAMDPAPAVYPASLSIKRSKYTGHSAPFFTFMGQASSHGVDMKAAVVSSPTADTLAQMRTDARATAAKCRLETPEGVAARSTWNDQYATKEPYKDSAGVPAPLSGTPLSPMNEQGYFTSVSNAWSYTSTLSAASRPPSAYERMVARMRAQTQGTLTQATAPASVDVSSTSNNLFDPTPTLLKNIVRMN